MRSLLDNLLAVPAPVAVPVVPAADGLSDADVKVLRPDGMLFASRWIGTGRFCTVCVDNYQAVDGEFCGLPMWQMLKGRK